MTRPPFEPYREQPSALFRWRLGVRPLDLDDWLVRTEHLDHELAEKARIMTTNADTAFAALDDVEPECREVGEAIVEHLHARYGDDLDQLRRTLDGPLHPLDAVARLVQEDLVLMVERDGRLVFGAGSVCFPNRWDLRSKLGRTMAEVHAPVAELNTQLEPTIDQFLGRLQPTRPVWRLGWGVIDAEDLYQPLDGTAAPRPVAAPPSAHHLRVERETLRRFPRTRCVLFTIHTHVTPLAELVDTPESATALAAAIDSLPTSIAEYKQLHATGSVIADWLRTAARTA